MTYRRSVNNSNASWHDTDIDWTSLPTQTISNDGTSLSITGLSGLLFDKINSANEVTHATITNGTGLTFTSSSAATSPSNSTSYTTNTRTLPALLLRPDSIYSGITSGTPMQMWNYHRTDNSTVNGSSGVSAIADDSPVTYQSYVAKYGHFATLGITFEEYFNQIQKDSYLLGASFYSAYNVTMLHLPDGIGEGILFDNVGIFSSDWSHEENLQIFNTYRPATGADHFELDRPGVAGTSWKFLIGAQGNETGYSHTFGRTKIRLFY